jgi:aryl-alcohol dehydrogenase-like predicted oxidoreductase
MHKRRLGNSTFEISELSFGTWLTVAGGIERQQAIRCIQTAFDNGINFFDTANQYGAGEAEQIVGEAVIAETAQAFGQTDDITALTLVATAAPV